MLGYKERFIKRTFDVVVASAALVALLPVIVLAWVAASIETRSNGFYRQLRIGKDAKPFFVYKIKTMRPVEGMTTTITTANDRRITKSGAFFRRTKIDELPQLFNVLKGDMSFVGPRPDVAGYADRLEGEDRIVLSVRPGITGPATLKYKNEEELLAQQENPIEYNDTVIWPDKVKINKAYVKNWSFKKDIEYLVKTFIG